MAKEKKPDHLIIGSGDLYYKEFATFADVPEDPAEMCIEDNYLACIKGGATLVYTPTYYTATDDNGCHKKSIMTEEEALLRTGLAVFNGDTLAVLSETARVTEDTNKHYRVLKIGGVKNATGKLHVFAFHHPDPKDGDIWIMIVGKNESGFELGFTTDNETVVDAEIKAMPQDEQGTLITYVEEDARITAGE